MAKDKENYFILPFLGHVRLTHAAQTSTQSYSRDARLISTRRPLAAPHWYACSPVSAALP